MTENPFNMSDEQFAALQIAQLAGLLDLRDKRIAELEAELDAAQASLRITLGNVQRAIETLCQSFGPLPSYLPDVVEIITEEYTRRCEEAAARRTVHPTPPERDQEDQP